MPSPALAILRRCEKTIDQPLVRSRLRIVEEGGGFLRCRRYSDKVKVCATQERFRRCVRRECQFFGLELAQHECVDRGSDALCRFHSRNRRGDRFAERPELAVFGADVRRLCFCELALCGFVRLGVIDEMSFVDPFPNRLDLVFAEWFTRSWQAACSGWRVCEPEGSSPRSLRVRRRH